MLRSKKHSNLCFLICVVFLFSAGKICGVDTLSRGQSLTATQTLISKDGIFELGFFTPSISNQNMYLGIWYKDFPKKPIVWVANRQSPLLNTSSSIISISPNGNLELSDNFHTVWSTNVTMSGSPDTIEAVLLDNGNLILRDASVPTVMLWQSFDHPTDTWLPGASIGLDRINGQKRRLVSWRNADDPTPGLFSVQMSPDQTLQFFLMWNSSTEYWKSGSWNGVVFSLVPEISYLSSFTFVMNENETYYSYSVLNNNVFSMLVINATGYLEQLTSLKSHRTWSITHFQPNSGSEIFGLCGKFGVSSHDPLRPSCTCLHGFARSSAERPDDWSGGCSRNAPLRCGNKKKESGEDILSFDFNYSNYSVKPNDDGTILRKRNNTDFDLPIFSYASVCAATNSFSPENKLGEGGFGPVYKGKLLNGQEIALKRLSKKSGQGFEEFRNEILLIAKLQHRNLVRLLGCCIDPDESILIYEYMPNKSLDFFLFDSSKQELLDWNTRVLIVEGIAQGLLYLHDYSRLRIIHRDLKASNILLDDEMNPKISDFGMARIFGGNDSRARTNRIVGTFGYMAPEYALEGLFSIKSDVFSFGVLVLEIVSGKKNTGFYNTDSLNLLGHAWELWISDRGVELMDPAVGSPPVSAVLRYINVGLLCVQQNPNDRPNMSSVISMLGNEIAPLPAPKQPAFSTRNITINSASEIGKCSVNGLTESMIEPR